MIKYMKYTVYSILKYTEYTLPSILVSTLHYPIVIIIYEDGLIIYNCIYIIAYISTYLYLFISIYLSIYLSKIIISPQNPVWWNYHNKGIF